MSLNSLGTNFLNQFDLIHLEQKLGRSICKQLTPVTFLYLSFCGVATELGTLDSSCLIISTISFKIMLTSHTCKLEKYSSPTIRIRIGNRQICASSTLMKYWTSPLSSVMSSTSSIVSAQPQRKQFRKSSFTSSHGKYMIAPSINWFKVEWPLALYNTSSKMLPSKIWINWCNILRNKTMAARAFGIAVQGNLFMTSAGWSQHFSIRIARTLLTFTTFSRRSHLIGSKKPFSFSSNSYKPP